MVSRIYAYLHERKAPIRNQVIDELMVMDGVGVVIVIYPQDFCLVLVLAVVVL